MTPNEFRLKHGAALKVFLNTECGRELLPILRKLRPLFLLNSIPHAHTESAGAVRGYEMCEKNIVDLTTIPIAHEELEMTYGVENKQPTN